MTPNIQLDHPRMKSTLISTAILAFAALSGLAEESQKSEPAQLAKIRTAWQQSVRTITAPLDLKYREALVKMKTDFTRAGNLEDALAVDAEIKSLDQREKPEDRIDPNEIVGTWGLKSPNWTGVDEYFPDGKVKQGVHSGTWTAKKGKLRVAYSTGNWMELDLPVRDGKLRGVDNHGKRITLTKMTK